MDTTSTFDQENALPWVLKPSNSVFPWCPLSSQRSSGTQSERVCHCKRLVTVTAPLRGMWPLSHSIMWDWAASHLHLVLPLQGDFLLISLVVVLLFIQTLGDSAYCLLHDLVTGLVWSQEEMFKAFTLDAVLLGPQGYPK